LPVGLFRALKKVAGRVRRVTNAIRAAARHLGYQRTGKKIQAAFNLTIRTALRRGLLERDGQNLRRV
jgi:hypothetical protein